MKLQTNHLRNMMKKKFFIIAILLGIGITIVLTFSMAFSFKARVNEIRNGIQPLLHYLVDEKNKRGQYPEELDDVFDMMSRKFVEKYSIGVSYCPMRTKCGVNIGESQLNGYSVQWSSNGQWYVSCKRIDYKVYAKIIELFRLFDLESMSNISYGT